MKVSEQSYFLCIKSVPDPEALDIQLTVTDDLRSLLKGWDAATRISPVWPLYITPAKGKDRFRMRSTAAVGDVIFMSYVDPGKFYDHIQRETIEALEDGQIWLSLGMHNIVVFSHSEDITGEIIDFCSENDVDFELWNVDNQAASDTEFLAINHVKYQRSSDLHVSRAKRTATAEKAYKFPELPTDDPLHFTILEVYALLAVMEARSEGNNPDLVSDCLGIEALVSDLLSDQSVSEADKRDTLLSLNAGLSRLVSQALSGVTPILRTECHFWPHSMLGLGIANVALRNVTDFVTGKVSDSLFHQKYTSILNKPAAISKYLEDKNEKIYFNINRKIVSKKSWVDLEECDGADAVVAPNPITYYSGRDGFRNGAFTTSAPIMSISGCNSIQWNLGTITHELSHRILSGKLEAIFRHVLQEIENCSFSRLEDYLKSDAKINFDVAGHLLSMTLLVKYAEEFPKPSDLEEAMSDPAEFLRDSRKFYSEEIEELSVHMFDYYHFYGEDANLYVNYIWQSWAVQPSIVAKLDHYIKRTITALSVSHYRLPDWEERAIKDFEKVLNSEPLRSKLEFYDKAHSVLNDPDSRESIILYLEQVQHLVAMFNLFLKSDNLRLSCSEDFYVNPKKKASLSSGSRPKYSASKLLFADDSGDVRAAYSNPLLFLRSFSTDSTPSPAKSAWLLHMLTFNQVGKGRS